MSLSGSKDQASQINLLNGSKELPDETAVMLNKTRGMDSPCRDNSLLLLASGSRGDQSVELFRRSYVATN